MECPNCHNANKHGDYEGPTCDVCHGVGYIVTDDMIRRACNAHGASTGACEFDWMRDALTAALANR